MEAKRRRALERAKARAEHERFMNQQDAEDNEAAGAGLSDSEPARTRPDPRPGEDRAAEEAGDQRLTDGDFSPKGATAGSQFDRRGCQTESATWSVPPEPEPELAAAVSGGAESEAGGVEFASQMASDTAEPASESDSLVTSSNLDMPVAFQVCGCCGVSLCVYIQKRENIYRYKRARTRSAS